MSDTTPIDRINQAIGLLNERLEETTLPPQAKKLSEEILKVEEAAMRKQSDLGCASRKPVLRLFSDSLRIDDMTSFPIEV